MDGWVDGGGQMKEGEGFGREKGDEKTDEKTEERCVLVTENRMLPDKCRHHHHLSRVFSVLSL